MASIRQAIAFDDKVLERLKNHIKDKYGNRRALSIVVQYSVIQYLDKEEGIVNKAKTKPRKPTIRS